MTSKPGSSHGAAVLDLVDRRPQSGLHANFDLTDQSGRALETGPVEAAQVETPVQPDWSPYGAPPGRDQLAEVAQQIVKERTEHLLLRMLLTAEGVQELVQQWQTAPEQALLDGKWAERRSYVRDKALAHKNDKYVIALGRAEFLATWRPWREADDDGLLNLIRAATDAEVAFRRGQLENKFREACKDDRLTLAEQGGLREAAGELGLGPAVYDSLLEWARSSFPGTTVAEPTPLRLQEAEAKELGRQSIDHPADLIAIAGKNLRLALSIVRQGLKRSRILTWLYRNEIYGRTHAIAEEIGRLEEEQGDKLQDTDEHSDYLAPAWRFLWAAGVPFLELNKPTARAGRRVKSVAELSEALRASEAPLNLLRHVISSRLLGRFLEERKYAKEAVSERLEREVASAEGMANKSEVTLWRVAFAAGVEQLPLKAPSAKAGTRSVLSTWDALLQVNINTEGLPEAAESGLLAAWLEIVHDKESEVAKARDIAQNKLRSKFGHQPSARQLLQIQLWCLGRQRLEIGQSFVPEPTAKHLVAALTSDREVWDNLTTAIDDKTLLAWGLTHKSEAVLRALAGATDPTPAGRRQQFLAGLGFANGLVWSAKGAHSIATVAELVQVAGALGKELDSPAPLAALAVWLQAAGHIKGKSKPDNLLELLSQCGDTTLRDISGAPLLVNGKQIGGLGVPFVAAVVTLVEQLEANRTLPSELLQLHKAGLLLKWLELRDTALHAKATGMMAKESDTRLQLQFVLSAIGFRQLGLADKLVRNSKQLIEVARGHLREVEELFDRRLLDTIASDDERKTLEALRTEVSKNAGLEKDPDKRAQERLKFRDRASLAIVALGGRPDRLTLQVPEDDVYLAGDEQSAFQVAVHCTRGDVPLIVQLRTQHGAEVECNTNEVLADSAEATILADVAVPPLWSYKHKQEYQLTAITATAISEQTYSVARYMSSFAHQQMVGYGLRSASWWAVGGGVFGWAAGVLTHPPDFARGREMYGLLALAVLAVLALVATMIVRMTWRDPLLRRRQ